jgi:cbb3-type cytochrome oxidase subunit 3
MKFKYYLEKIHHAEIFPMISLILFGAIFLFVIYYAFTADKKIMQEKSNIPFH